MGRHKISAVRGNDLLEVRGGYQANVKKGSTLISGTQGFVVNMAVRIGSQVKKIGAAAAAFRRGKFRQM